MGVFIGRRALALGKGLWREREGEDQTGPRLWVKLRRLVVMQLA